MLSDAPLFAEIADGPAMGRAVWFNASDGVRLRAAFWQADAKTGARGTVLLFPGRTEYAEKYGRTAKGLAQSGLATLAMDWRGQGLADRLNNDRMLGHVGKFSDYQLDVQAMLAAAKELGAPEPYYLLAHSMGGCIGLRALHEGLPVQAAVFSAPMWGIYIAPAMRPVAKTLALVTSKLGIGARLAPGTASETYVLDAPFDDNTLTTDEDMWNYMKRQAEAQPDLKLGGPSLHWLHEALAECKALRAMDAPDVRTRTYLGSNERIVDADRVVEQMARWPKGELVKLDGREHEVLMEGPQARAELNAEITSFFLST